MMDSANTNEVIEYVATVLNELYALQAEKVDSREVINSLIGNFYVVNGKSSYMQYI